MAKRDELIHKREVDRRVALLALAAEREATKQGSCLSVEEMALLLDGKCAADVQVAYRTHLSTCETCYREWLNLQQELSFSALVPKKPLLFQRKFLTLSGSLLAAAASLVFYLNLDTSPGPQDAVMLSVPLVEKRESAQGQRSPAPPVSVKKAKVQLDTMQAESVPQNGFMDMEPPAPAVSLAPESGAINAGASFDPFREWIQQIQEKCSEETVSQAEWKTLARRGRELSAADDLLRFESILNLVTQLAAGEASEPICAEIQEQEILKEKKTYEQ